MNVLKILKEELQLIKEGKSFRDKLILTIYFIKMPIRLFQRFLSYKTNHSLISEIKIKNKEGTFFCGGSIFGAWTASSFYENNLKRYFELSEGTFIDVGSNIGKHSIVSGIKLKSKGQVLAIEPEKKNFEILKKNIKINNLTNIIPINKGCFSKKATLKFYLDSSGTGGHSLVKETPVEKKGFIKIEVDTLDNIIKENKIKDVKLIKIDVEGAEAEVLMGAEKTLKKYHPKLIFEAWDNEHFEKIKKVLDKHNYQFKKIGAQDYIAT